MPFSANGENLKLGRGALFLAPWSGSTAPSGDSIGEFVGNITSLEVSSENETREKYSSSEQSSPLLDSRVIRQSYEGVAALDEHTLTNLKLFMSGQTATVSQSLNATATKSLASIVLGDTYYIGARNVTSVVVKKVAVVKTLGTDYLLDAEQGLVTFLATGSLVDGDTITVEFAQPALTVQKVQGGTRVSPTYKLTFQADDANAEGNAAGDRLTVWKVTVNADGAYPLISDDYASFGLRFKFLSDSANHPTEPFFILERV
jgi:hypothetical protein